MGPPRGGPRPPPPAGYRGGPPRQMGGEFGPERGPPRMPSGPPQPGCVLMVYGLKEEKINCQKLFNLFCLYGNVMRVCGFYSHVTAFC